MNPSMVSLFHDFLGEVGGVAVIDGGLATELERHGADLNDPLWSAKCLVTSPHLIREVHMDYLEAGADVITTASYQATLQGFFNKGLSKAEGEDVLRISVQIAQEARDLYYERCRSKPSDNNRTPRIRPILIAASVGSYGAYLADGSEYSGVYGGAITVEALKDFHRRRIRVLAESGADLIAFETIPNKIEAQAYAQLLDEERLRTPAWFSFNSNDGISVVSGDSIVECAEIAESCESVVAVGINCTHPKYIHALISSIKAVTAKPVLAYPNTGEVYDARKKEWTADVGASDEDIGRYVGEWRRMGASLFGGCCRTTPDTIKAIRAALDG